MKALYALLFVLSAALFAARYPDEKFAVALLKYQGNWNCRPNAVTALMIDLMNTTSINARLHPREITLDDRDLFYQPFLMMTGTGYFPPFSAAGRRRLRTFLEYGGFLFIDNASGERGGGFDKCVRRELDAIFPESPLAALPIDHSVYRSFYLSRRTYFGGRVKSALYLEGVNIGDVTPVIYSLNDAAGAWEKGPDGRFAYDMIPGGEVQRREAFKLGINLVLYSMTVNYKKDAIHVKTLLKRRRLKRVPWTK